MKTAISLLALIPAALISGGPPAAVAPVELRTNDVVAVVGGANSVEAARSGHLEALLLAAHPGHALRFRSLAWEGDTAFSQDREVNYPTIPQQLSEVRATVVFVDFGQAESYAGTNGIGAFRTALQARIREYTAITPRVVLLTPVPVTGPDPLPPVAAYAEVVRETAATAGLPVLDLFAAAAAGPAASDGNGRTLGPAAQATLWATALRSPFPAVQPPAADRDGHFKDPRWEELRGAILSRNRLWKRSVRPTNW
ncbi:MAG: hypothetical protein EBZ59_11630, partial [Planctomycetia bacterium]|nr:hypothetical protein [Planctomycetia bacterium]